MLVSGASAAIGLSPDGPPLSPAMVGRAPAIIDAASPVPLKSFEAILAERSAAEGTVVAAAPAAAPTPAPAPAPAAVATETRRVVLRLVGGEELELGSYDDRDAAVGAAQELIAAFGAAETSDSWPELDGRFVRPASVVSIDVLVEG